MDHDNLSPDVRHRLWQCYSLLLSLAEEAEQNTGNSELCEDQELAPGDKVNEMTQSMDDTPDTEQKIISGERLNSIGKNPQKLVK